MKHTRVAAAGPFCGRIRRGGECLAIFDFGLGQRAGQNHATAIGFGSHSEKVDRALQVTPKRGEDMLKVRGALHMAG